MTEIFKMPDIGEGMAEGEISDWLVKVGDQVKTDDSVAEVQNDKLLQEILSPYSGKVTKLFVEPGTTVKVGEPLIEFDGDGSGSAADDGQKGKTEAKEIEEPAESEKKTAVSSQASPAAPTSDSSNSSGAATASNGNILAMPSVRHYAHEHGIDLSRLRPVGITAILRCPMLRTFLLLLLPLRRNQKISQARQKQRQNKRLRNLPRLKKPQLPTHLKKAGFR